MSYICFSSLVFITLSYCSIVSVSPYVLHIVYLTAGNGYSVLTAHLPSRLTVDYCLKVIRSISRWIIVESGWPWHVLGFNELAEFVTVLFSGIIFVIIDLSYDALACFLAE